MAQLFLLMSLALIALWTARLARAKGQNRWVWGGASVVLMFLPQLFNSDFQLLGMLPIVILLFLKGPASQTEAEEQAIICSRCQTAHAPGHNFCVHCGWELGKPYAGDDITSGEQARPPEKFPQPPATVTETPASSQTTKPSPVEANQASTAEDTTVPVPDSSPAAERAPEAEAAPPVKVFSGPPTAERMTERGTAFLKEGRFQQAIDQFTKAIALDPDYKAAWSSRAEAYDKLGRKVEAAEDLRRLEAI